jgi:hypothetical protein
MHFNGMAPSHMSMSMTSLKQIKTENKNGLVHVLLIKPSTPHIQIIQLNFCTIEVCLAGSVIVSVQYMPINASFNRGSLG